MTYIDNRTPLQLNVGLKEPLVDSEGYPRSDLDVAVVRSTRVEIISMLLTVHHYSTRSLQPLNVIFSIRLAT